MEKWKEVFKGTIPQSNYQIRLINGEENGLIIKLYDVNNLVIIKFGNVRAVRMLDEGIVQTQIYAINELEKYKKIIFKILYMKYKMVSLRIIFIKLQIPIGI